VGLLPFRDRAGWLETLGAAGNLVSDAQMAALAMDHEAVLHTADTDFVRFEGLRWFNPITGTASANSRRQKSS
jgi:predicted nucleic acid-binding protein